MSLRGVFQMLSRGVLWLWRAWRIRRSAASADADLHQLTREVIRVTEQSLRASPQERRRLARLTVGDYLQEQGLPTVTSAQLEQALERATTRWRRAGALRLLARWQRRW